VASSFGAAGHFVVLMLWIYYSTQVFLPGAEFTFAYAHRGESKTSCHWLLLLLRSRCLIALRISRHPRACLRLPIPEGLRARGGRNVLALRLSRGVLTGLMATQLMRDLSKSK
jgi:hypothetical protein